MDNKQKKPGSDHGWLDHLFSSKQFLLVLSLAAAMVLWMIVISLQPNTEGTIAGVPVDLDINSVAYTSQNLDIIDPPAVMVRVRVTGDGSTLASLTAADVVVYPDYSKVTGEGTYTLPLEAKKTSSGLNARGFEIKEILPQDTIQLTFSKMATKKLDIEVNVSGVEPAEGYYVDRQPVVVPDTVTIRGPEAEVARVARAVAEVKLEGERSDSVIAPAVLKLLDANGSEVHSDAISTDTTEVEVTINVLKIKEVPLKLEFTGVPAGYDPGQLQPSLSQSTIRVAGPTEQVDALEEVTAGYVDLSRFTLGEKVTVDVMLPENLRNVDDLQTVDVTFNTYGYTTKTVAISADEIRAINVPAGTTVDITTQRINNVVLVGRAEELEDLSTVSVMAQVDASPEKISVRKGQQALEAKVIISGAPSVFAVGKYQVLCDINTDAGAASPEG